MLSRNIGLSKGNSQSININHFTLKEDTAYLIDKLNNADASSSNLHEDRKGVLEF